MSETDAVQGPRPGLYLSRLTLTDFRNYHHLDLRLCARVTVLSGPNGSGKTNLLEAVSMLVPGRGLRGARTADLARRGGPGFWAVAGQFHTPSGQTRIGTGTAPDAPADRRVFRLEGETVRSQARIAERTAAVWLTPQMDRLFLEGAAGRRRFLDRLVWALEPAHAREVAAHDAAQAQRNRLLAQGSRDAAWLGGLEDQIARHGVAITAARTALIARLNAAAPAASFPPARITLLCPIAVRLAAHAALATEDWLRQSLAEARWRDAARGSAEAGAQRADMGLADAATGLAAAHASTGQQKALLVGVILAHASVIAGARGFAPLLLLDEPAVHLDETRRRALFAALPALPAQTLLTGTDSTTFHPLRGTAGALCAHAGSLLPDPAFPPAPPVI